MPYLGHSTRHEGDSQNIKPAWWFPEALFDKIIAGRPDNPVDLSLVHCSQRINKEGILSAPHFRKNNCLSLAGYDVDLAKPALKISG